MLRSLALRVASASLGSATGTVRHMGMRTHWWQPVFPAMASLVAADIPGIHSKHRKKMQQRKQQSIAMHARNIEGARRNKIMRALKESAHKEKTKLVYQQYAEILRQAAPKQEDV